MRRRVGKWSGRVDLNHRPPGPEPGAITRLRYAPTVGRSSVGAASADLKISTLRHLQPANEPASAIPRAVTGSATAKNENPPERSLSPAGNVEAQLEFVAQREFHYAGLGG